MLKGRPFCDERDDILADQDLRAFSLRGKLRQVNGRVFIFHDPDDYVIPPQHSVNILAELSARGNPAAQKLLITRLVSHVTPKYRFRLREVVQAIQILSNLSEFMHSYGMVVGFAFTFYALFEGLDKRLIQFTAPKKRCAVIELCGRCVKSEAVPCGVRRIILVVLPAMLVLSTMPLAARLQSVSYHTVIFGTDYVYAWPMLYQLFEARYAPVLAMLLFSGAWAAMFLDRSQPVPDLARRLAAGGFGALGFGLMRFTFKMLFHHNLIWADYWEELTELLFVLAVGAVLIFFQLLKIKHQRSSVVWQSWQPYNKSCFRPITLCRQLSLVLPVRRFGDHDHWVLLLLAYTCYCLLALALACFSLLVLASDFRPVTLRPKLSFGLPFSGVWRP